MRKKLISVVIPAYNVESYLPAALESILAQTISDFEIILINDGSADRTGEIAEAYARKCGVIRVFHQDNKGLVASLNRGIELARGEFIARMDGDDLCLPSRFERQIKVMMGDSRIGVCGTWIESFGIAQKLTWRHPLENGAIQAKLLFRTALCHASVMIRTDLLIKNNLRYDPSHLNTEDYDLWVRMAPFTRFANVGEVLYCYRQHADQVTRKPSHNGLVLLNWRRIHGVALRRMGFEPTEEQLNQHCKIVFKEFSPVIDELRAMDGWLRTLAETNRQRRHYPEPQFADILSEMWWGACQTATGIGLPMWWLFLRSPISSRLKLDANTRFRFMAKCLLRRGLPASAS